MAESGLTKVAKERLYSLAEELLEISHEIGGADAPHRGGVLKNLIRILTQIVQALC